MHWVIGGIAAGIWGLVEGVKAIWGDQAALDQAVLAKAEGGNLSKRLMIGAGIVILVVIVFIVVKRK